MESQVLNFILIVLRIYQKNQNKGLPFAPHLQWVIETPSKSAFAFLLGTKERQHDELPRSLWIETVSDIDLSIHIWARVNSLWQAPGSITEKPPGCRREVSLFVTGWKSICLQGYWSWAVPVPRQMLALTSSQAHDDTLVNFYLHTSYHHLL